MPGGRAAVPNQRMKPIPGGQACGFAALRGLSAAPLGIMKGAVFFALVFLSACAAAPIEEQHDFFYSFLAGEYVVVGMEPDGGATFSGTAHIKHAGTVLTLTKRVGGNTVVAEGRIDRASPGEAVVVRFSWPGHSETCLPHSDLDNYGRLTCYWIVNGKQHNAPGLEAYFSTEAWP